MIALVDELETQLATALLAKNLVSFTEPQYENRIFRLSGNGKR